MKHKFFTLFLTLAASVGTIFAHTLSISAGEGGIVNTAVNGEYEAGTEVTIVATPEDGYEFIQWSDGITDNPRSVIITTDTTFTAEFELITSGKCGDNLTWRYSNGVLTISGSGDMYDYVYNSYPNPFSHLRGNIKTIIIEDGVTSIGYNAFEGCYGLTSIEIPNSVTSIGVGAFEGCSGLTSIEIPNSVTSIGDRAFKGCFGLTSVAIPNSVTSIGVLAFHGCNGLTLITIGKDLPIVDGWWIFGNKDNQRVYSDHPNLIHVEAPAWFFDVVEEFWSYCPKYMTNIKVNAGTLTDNAFSVIKRNYKTLKTLDISNVENTTLADEAFKDNYNLIELILPAGLTSVSYMAVAGCKNLKSIDIPASVEEIDQSAFEDCRSIETITFGGKQPSSKPGLRMEAAESKLRKIGNWAFYNAHQLQHLEIPEGVEEIGDGAFYGCTYLQDLVLPKSIKAIGDNCFALCSHLERIDVEALTPPTIFARTFFDVSRQIPVYVPEDVVAEYLNDEYWKEMNIQGAPTAIEEVSGQQSEVRNQKIMRNGQLLILSNGGTYNAQGVRVE